MSRSARFVFDALSLALLVGLLSSKSLAERDEPKDAQAERHHAGLDGGVRAAPRTGPANTGVAPRPPAVAAGGANKPADKPTRSEAVAKPRAPGQARRAWQELVLQQIEDERIQDAEDRMLDAEDAKRDAREKEATQAAQAAAQQEARGVVPGFLEKLPGPVKDVVTGTVANMVVSRAPPDHFLYGVFDLPRGRFGSGTSWLPDASPLYFAVPHIRKWGLIIHGNVYAGYNWYSSDRGWHRFMGRNTLMGAIFRTFRRSEVLLRLALSLEPLTIGTRGYPQILQTGQTTDGERISDKMYALDFFRELAVTYQWEVTRKWAALLYLAAAGEPALGPVTFTQRISASADPLAPLGFQAQENSHASFGVLTVGGYTREFKLEVSWFNGELPGDERYRIDIRKPDSYSIRASWNPLPQWSLQLSYGFLERPLQSSPEISVHRFSTSATYTQWHADGSGISSTASFAERLTTGGDTAAAFLLEGYWNIDGNHSVFGRAELLQRTGEELRLPEPTSELFAVGSLATGYVYYFGPYLTLAPGLGVRMSINPMENDLSRFYGTQIAYGLMAFAQLRTSALPIEHRARQPDARDSVNAPE